MITIQQYLQYVDEIMIPTEAMFELVPDEKIDWSVIEGFFTLGQLMGHIAGAVGVYAGGITKGDWTFQSMREILVRNRRSPSVTKSVALDELRKNVILFKSGIAALTPEEFNAGTVFAPQFGGNQTPRWRIALLFLEHHNNHKAELFMSLKVMGQKLNTGHLYRG